MNLIKSLISTSLQFFVNILGWCCQAGFQNFGYNTGQCGELLDG